MTRALVSLAALAVACGPKPAPQPPVPQLPGDGDANVVKPPPPPDKPKIDDPWAGRTDLLAAPAPKPAARVELPAIQEFKLANGLDVFVIESRRLPVASVQLAIKAGRAGEPRARLGVAEATADMLVKGTKRHDALGLAKAIDAVGGTIAADSTYEATLLSCNVLSRDLRTCLELVPELATEPTFPADELTKLKERLVGNARQRLEDTAALASTNVLNLLWGDAHVRGWAVSEQSIIQLGRDDLIAWHKTWYAPNNSLLVIAGDVDAKKLKPELERTFGAWKKSTVPPVPSYREAGLSGIRIRVVDRPGLTQTQIRVAQYGIKHDDTRFFDSVVWNHALANRLARLGRGGRVFNGSSSFDRNLDRGSFVAQAITRSSDAIAATKLLENEIARMQKEGPTDDEVRAAIATLAGGYASRFQAVNDIGAALVGADLHGFGLEYLAGFPVNIGKVTADSARAAAAEILDPNNFVVVLVGDAKDLEPLLKKEGWRFETRKFTEPVSPPPATTMAPTADPKQQQAAKKLIDDALAAKGGKAKLAAVKAIKLTASGQAPIEREMMPVDVERTVVPPDHLRIDATIHVPQAPAQNGHGPRPAQDLKVVVGLDGKVAWNADVQGQVREIPAANRGEIDFELWRDPDFVLLKAAAPDAKLAPHDDETVDGKPCAVVELGSPYGIAVLLYFDKKTKLLSRLAYAAGGQKETDDFLDYKDVKGIKVSMKRVTSSGGTPTTLTVSKVEIDPPVDAKSFAKPPPK